MPGNADLGRPSGERGGAASGGSASNPLSDVDLLEVVRTQPKGSAPREAATTELVSRYKSLVVSCAARYAASPESRDELVQVGYLGLMRAITHYDSRLGVGLAGYALPCIRGEIKRYFRDKRWNIRIRRVAKEIRAEVLQAESELQQSLARDPTDAEIAVQIGRTVDDVQEGRKADRAFHYASLDAPLSLDGEAATLVDFIGSEDTEVGTATDMDAVWPHIAELPEREQKILLMRYYGNMTQAQIGQQMGLSQMHVSRLLTRALGALHEALVS